LAALNHGTFRSPIQGQEGALVLARLRQWAAQVGEIHSSWPFRNRVVLVGDAFGEAQDEIAGDGRTPEV
jgi:hypothetical protein